MMPSWILTLALQSPRTPKTPPTNEEIFTNWQWITDTKPLMSPMWAVIVIGGVLLILVIVKIVERMRNTNRKDGPMLVFHQVAKQMELDISTQWLLIRVSQQQNLPTPLTLLICGSTFVHHSKAYVKSLPSHRQKQSLAQLSKTHRYLFA
ncbi:MAG: hypothetical protein JKX85_11765 [Phycisphaeraceae bacterium]|nr:hypothetical protein [Phycisphaeraceae bacterium]